MIGSDEPLKLPAAPVCIARSIVPVVPEAIAPVATPVAMNGAVGETVYPRLSCAGSATVPLPIVNASVTGAAPTRVAPKSRVVMKAGSAKLTPGTLTIALVAVVLWPVSSVYDATTRRYLPASPAPSM